MKLIFTTTKLTRKKYYIIINQSDFFPKITKYCLVLKEYIFTIYIVSYYYYFIYSHEKQTEKDHPVLNLTYQ